MKSALLTGDSGLLLFMAELMTWAKEGMRNPRKRAMLDLVLLAVLLALQLRWLLRDELEVSEGDSQERRSKEKES